MIPHVSRLLELWRIAAHYRLDTLFPAEELPEKARHALGVIRMHPAAWSSRERKNPLKLKQALEEMGIELRRQSWRAISGRLLYDFESKGVGYFVLPASTELSCPAGMDKTNFRNICASVMRILTEEYGTDPSQFDSPN